MSFNVLINQKCLLHKHTTPEWITKPNHYSNLMVKYRPCIWWENVWLLLFFLSTYTNAAMVDCWANLADTFYDLGSWFGFGWWFNSHLIKWIGYKKEKHCNVATCKTIWHLWLSVVIRVRFRSTPFVSVKRTPIFFNTWFTWYFFSTEERKERISRSFVTTVGQHEP